MNFMFYVLCFISLIYSAKSIDYKPVVIAHRGASGYLPEHTLESKAAAFIMGADYLEQDVVLTKDYAPIVLHDLYLDEVTNVATEYPNRKRVDGRYYAIDFTLKEIKTLKVAERFKHIEGTPYYPSRFPVWKSSFELSTLEEEIELVQGMQTSFKNINSINSIASLANKNFNIGIYVEIKNPEFHKAENRGNFSEIVLDILKKYGYTKKNDKAIIQCFDPIELRRIRNELKSELTLVQLLEDNQIINGFDWTNRTGLEAISKFADGIGPEKSQLVVYNQALNTISSSKLYKDSKDLKLFMHPYTFRIDSLPKYASNYKELLKIFLDDLKVDGLFTDFPDVTLRYLNNQAKLKINFFTLIVLLKITFLFKF